MEFCVYQGFRYALYEGNTYRGAHQQVGRIDGVGVKAKELGSPLLTRGHTANKQYVTVNTFL